MLYQKPPNRFCFGPALVQTLSYSDGSSTTAIVMTEITHVGVVACKAIGAFASQVSYINIEVGVEAAEHRHLS